MQIAHFHGEVQTGQQLPGDDQTAVHDAVDDRVAVLQLLRDGRGHLVHRGFHLLLGIKAIRLVHHLSDVIEIKGHASLRGKGKSDAKYCTCRGHAR